MIAQEFRLRAAATPTKELAERFGLSEQEIVQHDPEVIVLPDGELPEDSMQVQTVASGEQIPLPRRSEFDEAPARILPPPAVSSTATCPCSGVSSWRIS